MDQNVQSYPEAGLEELPPAPKKKGPNIILVIVIVLLLLCCCCVVIPLFAYFMYYYLGDPLTDWLGITKLLVPGLFLA